MAIVLRCVNEQEKICISGHLGSSDRHRRGCCVGLLSFGDQQCAGNKYCGGVDTISGGDLLATDNGASVSLALSPDHRYHWVSTESTGDPSAGASTQFYGATGQTVSPFSDLSLGSARFTTTGDSGVLFSN